MDFLDSLETREIANLPKPLDPALVEEAVEEAVEQPATQVEAKPEVAAAGESTTEAFPQEKVQVVEEVSDLSDAATSILKQAMVTQVPDVAPQTRITVTPSAIDQLAANEAAPGERLHHSFASPFPDTQEVLRHEKAKDTGDRSYEKALAAPTTGDQRMQSVQPGMPRLNDGVLTATNQTTEQVHALAMAPCALDLRLIAQKLRRFNNVFYLNPQLWESKTLDYMFKAYAAGMSLKAIYDKVSVNAKQFSDASGNMIPSFKEERPELGSLKLMDVYAILSTCLYASACGPEPGYVRAKDKRLVGGFSQRKIRQEGEVSLTTFVDIIFFDWSNPNRMGHGAIASWLQKCDEPISAYAVRRFYETILQQFRLRWKAASGVPTALARKKITTGDHVLQQLDVALAEHTAILEYGSRRFLLMEWPNQMPTELPRYQAVSAKRPPSDFKLFLRKVAERFDPAVPFDSTFINGVRQELGPAGGLTVELSDPTANPFDGTSQKT